MVNGAHKTARFQEDETSSDSLRRPSGERDIEAQTEEAPVMDTQKAAQTTANSSTLSPTTDQPGSLPSPSHRKRADSVNTRSSFRSLRRRRTNTQSVPYGPTEMGRATGWMPGGEPGVDTSDPSPPYSASVVHGGADLNLDKLQQRCEITCVDYSEDNWTMVNLDNDNLQEHLDRPRPSWSQVRWINVNGLSWDVIRAIGNWKALHRLAIEDLMNTRSRTKADWYRDHVFIVLPLQKLVNVNLSGDGEEDDEDDDDKSQDEEDFLRSNGHGIAEDSEYRIRYMHERVRRRREEKQKKKYRGAIATLINEILHPQQNRRNRKQDGLTPSQSFKTSQTAAPWAPRHVRTLQRWHTGPNQDRTAYMERNAALAKKGLSVSMEQVSIFLCADNTVISFFEYSAEDIEVPILRRLHARGTILRQSCDASMLMQAILDGIVDLAIPVTTAYEDTLGDLELEVLTDPAITESKDLYILTSEIATLRNAIAPVAQLMSALRDHKSESSLQITYASSNAGTPGFEVGNPMPDERSRPAPPPARKSFGAPTTVTISPLTVLYLGDALDHAILIRDAYDQMRRSADNLVDLIFNTISAFQNENMKQLTLATCFFLPLTFMTGYFGMNFQTFDAVKNNSDAYFWYIAAPVSVATLLIILFAGIYRWVIKVANKALIVRGRRRRLAIHG